MRRPHAPTSQGGGTNNAIVSGEAEASDTVGFTIVIP
jgi:hypothetical protein